MNGSPAQQSQSSSILDRAIVILTGTDPKTARGGIGVVMNGYLRALQGIPVRTEMVPTYRPASWTGKWQPWLVALFKLPPRLVAARRNGLRPIVYSHCGAMPSMIRESVVLLLARLCGAITILQVHSPEMDGYLRKPLQRWLIRTLFRPAHYVGALTPWWAERFRSAGVCRRQFVVPNPLPADLEATANLPTVDSEHADTIMVLTMARLVAGKGADISIRAMAGLADNYRLVVAGDGDQKPRLEQMARDLGIAERVHFAGWVSGADKDLLLQSADIFCLPSTNDVFPTSIVEAMVNGKPVVSLLWGGIPDLVKHEQTGLLCTPDDPDAVREALTRLGDSSLRQAMGEKAKEEILSLSGSANVSGMLAAIITGTLSR